MFRKKVIILCFVFFLLFSLALTKEKKIPFDGQQALSYIKDLASDTMKGRKSGQPGGEAGAEYIASRFKEWGLEPLTPEGSYFQDFTIEHRNVEEGVLFEIIAGNSRRNFYYGEDWRVQPYSGSGNFVAEIVFAGYGIHAPQKEYDDYAGVDIKGKWVLFSTDSPRRLEEKLKDEAKMDERIKAAQELGARGILAFRMADPQARQMDFAGMKKENYKQDFVFLSLENKIVDFIFKDLKTELRYLFQQIEETSKPVSFETGIKAFVSVSAIFDPKRPTRNVLAKISGVDKDLKNECVIIGAHMDHLGIDPLGEVMNGADDNASGTAVVMEIARIMRLAQFKPKRTVIFGLWAGEEQGFLGSKYYTEHPLFPVEKTLAYINMDMVGHGSGKVRFSGKYYGPTVWDVLKQRLPKQILDYVIEGRGGPGGSDHTPFLEKGIPGFGIMTEGYHFKYHREGDEIDLIKPEILKKTGDCVEQAVEILASEPGNFFPPRRQEMYHLKYQNLINFELPPLDEVIENHKDAKDSHVDLQLAIVTEKEGMIADELRIDILKTLLSGQEKIRESKGLSLYTSSNQFMGDIRQGKTTIMPGLRGINSFRDDPRWAEVLAKQGIYFVIVDNPSFLFAEKELSLEGKKIIEALSKSGLLLIVSSLESSQEKILLENTKKPLILLEKDLPDKEVLELIKKTKSALGLILSRGEEGAFYFTKLEEARKALGSEYLMIVNQECLWKEAGKEQMLDVISERLKVKFETGEVPNLFSATFLRVLGRARGEEPSRPFAFIPF